MAKENISSWYPVHTSESLGKGKLVAIRLFETEFILFRANDGSLSVVSRFCPHMGTDLANGDIVGNYIRCPMHHWKFDGEGVCVDIPRCSDIPKEAKLSKLPVEEKYGIIFVFFGKEPLFALPEIIDIQDVAISKVRIIEFETCQQAVALNNFELGHLFPVHNRISVGVPKIYNNSLFHFGMKYSTEIVVKRLYDKFLRLCGFHQMHIDVDCWGGSILTMNNKGTKYVAFGGLAPTGENSCSGYFVTICENSAKNPLSRMIQALLLEFSNYLVYAFIKPDLRPFKNMQSKAGVLLPSIDDNARKFWKFWKNLPREEVYNAP